MSWLDCRARSLAACLAVPCLMLAVVTTCEAGLNLVGSWPTEGNPHGVAVEPNGTLLLNTTTAVPELLRYTPDGTLLRSLGLVNYSPEVYGLAVAPDGEISYAWFNPGSFNIRFLSPDGTFLYGFGGPWGGATSSKYVALTENEVCVPYKLPVACSGVYVTDPVRSLVVRFQKAHDPAYGGFFVESWPSHRPSGIATHGSVVYVASWDGGTITKYTREGNSVGSFPTGAIAAEAMAAGPDGRLYLADRGDAPGRSRLLVFSPDGALVDSVASDVAGYPYGPAEFIGVAVASDGTVFAGDHANGRVLKFSESDPTATEAVTWGRIKTLYR